MSVFNVVTSVFFLIVATLILVDSDVIKMGCYLKRR